MPSDSIMMGEPAALAGSWAADSDARGRARIRVRVRTIARPARARVTLRLLPHVVTDTVVSLPHCGVLPLPLHEHRHGRRRPPRPGLAERTQIASFSLMGT